MGAMYMSKPAYGSAAGEVQITGHPCVSAGLLQSQIHESIVRSSPPIRGPGLAT